MCQPVSKYAFIIFLKQFNVNKYCTPALTHSDKNTDFIHKRSVFNLLNKNCYDINEVSYNITVYHRDMHSEDKWNSCTNH